MNFPRLLHKLTTRNAAAYYARSHTPLSLPLLERPDGLHESERVGAVARETGEHIGAGVGIDSDVGAQRAARVRHFAN